MENQQANVEEIAMLLGMKDIQIMLLQKQLQAAQQRIAELTPKPQE